MRQDKGGFRSGSGSGAKTQMPMGPFGRQTLLRREPTGGVLDKQAILLLAVQALFGIALALSGTFVPIYLWKASSSYMLVGWFTMSQYLTCGITFWLAGKWVKEYNKMNSLRTGIVLSGAFYFTVLLLGRQAASFIIPLGILNGIALGLFWVAFDVIYFEITEPDNRDRFNGWSGLLGSGAGILAPWVSGLLITSMRGERGYQIIFSASLVILGLAVVLSFWLKKRKQEGRRYNWRHGFQQLAVPGNPWRRVLPAVVAQGVREGVFLFLVGLTVYIATQNEAKLGSFTLITSFVALISFWLVGKRLSSRNRKRAMLIGTIMNGLVILPLFYNVNFTTLLLFGIGTSIFMPLYIIPMTSRVFDLIGESQTGGGEREEYIVLREAGLTFGRVLGLTGYLIVLTQNNSPLAVVWLLFIVGSVPIIGWWLMRPLLDKETV
ncbi:MFS transporter, YQGE family, putative transporter [Paenibacillus algorifonticola]|uniref:MFS transporter, YQGE family, putative transporter n=1 Tax=Paenibacillus algorifonticola TaxID=684063 RepID=A0A1I2G5R1_9BACL|nr:MFS transporter [Paenibacillus algorifonticola]SFF12463.1 MFS transporter, YQGE family, putative transporter [Paenibacillus algorifonticola]